MHFVYMLRSLANPKKTYVGITDDVDSRLAKHNSGGSPHTSKYAPWEIVTYIGVRTKAKAAKLEQYLKRGSGHAFAKKHLW
jgi:predicted GIY-YIG superfamily endonuclease